MEPIIEIQKMGLTRLDNALHVRYHSDVYDIIHALDVTKLGLTIDLMNEWEGNINDEKDINLEALADLNTKMMTKKDAERDKLVTFILNVVHAYTQSPDADEAEAAAELEVITNRYKGIQRESVERETAHIIGLLVDLKKSENAPYVTTLRLTAAVGLLEAANTAFDKARTARTSARANSLPMASEARAKTDSVYERIVLLMKAAYISGVATIDRTLIATVAKEMNQRMDEINETYRQSQAKKKAAANKKPKDPKQPKDPKDPKPKDPKDPKKPEGGGDDIHVPSEPPKKPEDKDKPKQPETGGGTGGGDDIHVPSEPPKKPDGQ